MLCHQEIKVSVTVIPFAHSYCRKCRKSFMGQCFICVRNEQIKATYANMIYDGDF